MMITIPFKVEPDMIRNLFESAFEGGYSPEVLEVERISGPYDEAQRLVFYGQDGYFEAADWRMRLTCWTATDEDKEEAFEVGPAEVEKGLQILAAKYPHHFADIVRENTDAITGDVFVQCCIYGEIVYG